MKFGTAVACHTKTRIYHFRAFLYGDSETHTTYLYT